MAYDIGLDLGTNSIGWAVIGEDGDLCKFKKQRMHGTIISFQESNKKSPNEVRRGFRSTRRRLQRRKQRISWLQDLMYDLVAEKDPELFVKLKYSYLSPKDEAFDFNNILHVDRGAYKSLNLNSKYPTIFHLRKSLIENGREDIRLVYLALHHIVGNRGNFLYEGQKISLKDFSIKDSIEELFALLDIDIEQVDFDYIMDILGDNLRKSEKKEKLITYLLPFCNIEEGLPKKAKTYVSEVANAITGSKVKLNILTKQDDKLEISFDQELSDDVLEKISEDDMDFVDAIQKVHSGLIVLNLVAGDSVQTVSDCYINRFKKHGQDLVVLKRAIRRYYPEKYQELINAPVPKKYKNKEIKNFISYAMYIAKSGSFKRELYVERIKKLFLETEFLDKNQNDQDLLYIKKRVEEGDFLSKLKTSDNGSIPYQFNVEEMKSIIENQGMYYPELLQIKEKLIQIVEFRIPYFVGPLQARSPFAWISRTSERITPWNFDSVVDLDDSEVKFIKRMTLKCTELMDQSVLPKSSPTYQKFCVLNELANIKINGNRLSPEYRVKACNDLFMKYKTVSVALFSNWVAEEHIIPIGEPKISGFADEKGFTSSLSTMIEFKKILGADIDYLDPKVIKMIENIVEMLTVTSSKERAERYIVSNYPFMGIEAAKKIAKIKCKGWGRLSGKLLTGLFARTENKEPVTIMDLLETTDQNYNEIKFNKQYGFNKLIEDYNKGLFSTSSVDEYIDKYPISPAVRRITRTAYKAVGEIINIMGGELPRSIYIETASGEWPLKKKQKKTLTRYEAIDKQLKEINDSSFDKVKSDLKNNKTTLSKEMTIRQMLYFLQNGKCLYSGTELDFGKLKEYQIDHIIPRCYIRDNGLSNLALVMDKANQRKGDSLLLEEEIIASQVANWKVLLDNKLMTRKKFFNLTRRELTNEDLNRFVNRQLVETRQEIKLLMDILKLELDVDVYGVSAQLTTSIRKQFMNNYKSLTKVREVNDFHHADDAYLAAKIGYFAQKRFSPNSKWILEFKSNIQDNEEEAKSKDNHGIIAYLFGKNTSFWKGFQEMKRIASNCNTRDYFIRYLTEEQTGEFYGQTKMPKGEGTIALSNKCRSIDVYGGYIGDNEAYSVVAKKGKKLKLVGIPIRISVSGQDTIDKYLKDNDYEILSPRKICKYQQIKYKEKDKISDYLITASGEVINAKQLYLDDISMFKLYKLLNNEVELDQTRNSYCDYVFKDLINHMRSFCCYSEILQQFETNQDNFISLSSDEKIQELVNILKVTHANASRIDSAGWKTKGVVKGSRMSKALTVADIVFVDKSITGMYVKLSKADRSNM